MGRMTEAAHFRTETSSFWNAVSSMVSKVPKVSLVSMVSMVSEVSMVSKVFMVSKVSKASKPFMLSMVSSKDSKVSMVSKVSMHLSLSSQCRWTKSHLCLCSKLIPFSCFKLSPLPRRTGSKNDGSVRNHEVLPIFLCPQKKTLMTLTHQSLAGWATSQSLQRLQHLGQKNGCWMGQNPVAWFLHQNSWDLWMFISVEIVLIL